MPGHLISVIRAPRAATPAVPEVESRRTPWNHPAPLPSEALTHPLSTLLRQTALALAADPVAAVGLWEIPEYVHAEPREWMPQSS